MTEKTPIRLNKPIDLRWMDEHNRIVNKYAGESDRAVAVLAASFLDEQLRQSLESVLIDDATLVKKVFSNYGPLGSFSARIDLAYALGHISTIVYKDLHRIRKLRNAFAHHADVIDFNAEAVQEQCAKLETSGRIDREEGSGKPLARDLFLWAISACIGEIRMGAQFIPRSTVPEAGPWL